MMSAPKSKGRWKKGEGIIDDEERVAAMGDLAGGGEIGEAHQRIGGRFHQDHARRGGHRIGDALGVAGVDIRERHAETLQQLVEEPEGAAVHVLAADDVIACPEQQHDRGDAAHAGAEREAVAAALEGGYVALQRLARGVLAPRVLVSLVLAQSILHICGRLVDRRHDGAGEGLGALARMDGAGRKPCLEIVVVHARHADTAPGRVGEVKIMAGTGSGERVDRTVRPRRIPRQPCQCPPSPPRPPHTA
jgi:hypothetical protein